MLVSLNIYGNELPVPDDYKKNKKKICMEVMMILYNYYEPYYRGFSDFELTRIV
jgi:hypothetical protein